MSEKREQRPDHQLTVLTDPTGRKMADKLYDVYIVGEEAKRKGKDNAAYRRMPEFCLALDRLISEFGGKPIPEDEPVEGGSPDTQEDPGYHEDEDIHEASVDRLKLAIARLIR